jgi:hypothetical protein
MYGWPLSFQVYAPEEGSEVDKSICAAISMFANVRAACHTVPGTGYCPNSEASVL